MKRVKATIHVHEVRAYLGVGALGDRQFRVVKMVNTTRHEIGEIITKKTVDSMNENDGIAVTITAAK